jgi:hypothetical protein
MTSNYKGDVMTARLINGIISQEEYDQLPIDSRLKAMHERLFHDDTAPEHRAMIIEEAGRYSGR